MYIKQAINELFNWKKNPASVFLIAAPLAIIGFGLLFLNAMIHWLHNDDPWFLVIFAFGLFLLGLGLWPIRKFIFNKLS